MAEPIVLQLQADCLNAEVSISVLLRKAKLIASKLELDDVGEWLESELNGYKVPRNQLPPYRSGMGMPKFFNPYHGWMDIVVADGRLRESLSTCHLPQAIAEIEHLSISGSGGFVILGFPSVIDEVLHNTFNIEFNCGLHVSKTVLIGALEGIRNAVLEWTLALERDGILGQGLSFSKSDVEKAQMVTNHIYNSNVGMVGNMKGESSVVQSNTSYGQFDYTQILLLVQSIKDSAKGLPAQTARAVSEPLANLESAAKIKDKGRVAAALSSIKTVLEGAGGNLAAAGILAAVGGIG